MEGIGPAVRSAVSAQDPVAEDDAGWRARSRASRLVSSKSRQYAINVSSVSGRAAVGDGGPFVVAEKRMIDTSL